MSEPNTNGATHDAQALGADRPQENIKDDAFAYAPFAETVAKAVLRLPDPHGQIIAIHGPWGMGKTSFLNFVKHYLRPEHVSAEEKNQAPIVIDFNPWWFAGHEQLAGQFLAQFAAHLPKVDGRFHQIVADLGKYARLIGTLVSVATLNPLAGNAVSAGLQHSKTEAKDVPTLKKEIAKALEENKQRFLVMIDDIDRLEPKEIRELFKVLKALADFPNVIYLLAFDREVVAQSLEKELGIDGNAWLEKIVQAQFSLPKIMPEKLERKFFDDVAALLREPDGKNVTLDEDQQRLPEWEKAYREGLCHLIQTPRNQVRLMASLAVTYPGLRGLVNGFDFVLIECLRIFRPAVYAALRDHYDEFARKTETEFKNNSSTPGSNWLRKTFEQWKEKERNSLELEAIHTLLNLLGFMCYTKDLPNSDELKFWPEAKKFRPHNSVNDPNRFSFYFQFGVAPERKSEFVSEFKYKVHQLTPEDVADSTLSPHAEDHLLSDKTT